MNRFLMKVLFGPAQRAELQFQRYQAGFVHTLDLGRQLFAMADQETQEQLQADLGTLQEDWDKLQNLLGRRTELAQTVIKVTERLLQFRSRVRNRSWSGVRNRSWSGVRNCSWSWSGVGIRSW